MKYLTIAVLFGLLFTATSSAQTDSGLSNSLLKKLDEIVKAERFPGATLAVVFDNGTIIDLANGFEDPELEKPLAVGARMFCGSTGKTFVSAVALQLVAEEKLELDALASSYFDGQPNRDWFDKLPNAKSITVRSLMNHTSGLPRYLFQPDFLADLKANPKKSRPPQENLAALHGVDPLFAVGEGWAYSDSNYLVLGLLIEQVSEKPFYENAQSRILDPLKLSNTIPSTQAKLEGLVQGHIGSMNFFGLPEKTVQDGSYAMNPDFEWCGGGFVTNVGDLAKWIHELHSGNVVEDTIYSQLISPVDFRSGEPADSGYGLGSFVWDSKHGKFYGHAGIMPGYLTQIEHSADHGFTIAFQTNTDQGMGQSLHGHVQEIAQLIISSKK